MFEPTGFLKSNNFSSVSEDKNFSPGGRSCGKSGDNARVIIGTGLAVPVPVSHFGEDQALGIGRIAAWVPMS